MRMDSIEKRLAPYRNKENLSCVGLDLDPRLMPHMEVSPPSCGVMNAASELACAYKPNLVLCEALATEGLRGLKKTPSRVPTGVRAMGNASKGDIGANSEPCARSLLETLRFNAATLNPLRGQDAISSLTACAERAVLINCKT